MSTVGISRANGSIIMTLSPCPFCGDAEPDLDTEPAPGCGDPDVWWVQCTSCQAEGPRAFLGCRDDDDEKICLEVEAIEMWNERKAVTK